MDISIVIPAFEESKKIAADVKAASAFIKGNNLSGEIIVADDGSSDSTSDVAKTAASSLPPEVSFKVIRCDSHMGKGHAVREGVKETIAEYVMFADSGCCVPYENILDGLELIKNGDCDIAHGSRKLREGKIEKPQSCYRRICGRMFHWFISRYTKIPAELTDTQCGFKIYKGEVARKLYGQCKTNGFMFDAEIILRALNESYRIKEFPVQWTCDRDSRLTPARSLLRILFELRAIKRAIGKGSA